MTSRLSATLWSALRYGGSSNTGGTLVYRGFQAAHLAAHPPPAPAKSPRSSLDASRPSSVRSGSPLRAENKKKEKTNPKPPSLRARQSLEDLRANLGDKLGDKLRLGEEIAHELGEGVRKGVGELVGVTPIEGAEGLGPGDPAGRDPEASGAGGGAPDQLEGVDLPNKVRLSPQVQIFSPKGLSDDWKLAFCVLQKDNGDPGEPPSDEVTDLILVVHGIGQQLAVSHEGFNFVYATNILRKEAQKQALSPALRSIMRDRQVQFLPIQWRASLKLNHSGAEAQEDIDHELHNRCVSEIQLRL